MKLNTPLSELPGVGPKFMPKLNRLGLKTVRDLVYHFPFRYEDWSELAKVAELNIGETKTVQAEIKDIEVKRAWQRRMTFVEAVIADDSGEIKVVWFNQPYIAKTLKPGTLANFAGKVAVRNGEAYLSNPAYELVGRSEAKHTGRLVPIYPETKGLTSRGLRYLLKPIIEHLEDAEEFIPENVITKNDLPEINHALKEIHFPGNMREAERARYRFAYEEIFLLQIRNLKQKMALKHEDAPELEIDEKEISKLIKDLPFELTTAQKTALEEIIADFEKPYPMNRLLQGDVGSGKTVVAGLAGLAVAKTHQVAIMAPTEILARQHYRTFIKLFGGFSGGIALLSGQESKVYYGPGLESDLTKAKLSAEINSGRVKITIGTHALVQKNIKFPALGLVVIDEQHRFGVNQRAHLIKQGAIPHFLSMSATPIPRTMMIALFGDLDISLINELPKGRKEIITKVVAPENRAKAYAFIRGEVRKGKQVYVVCPRIETSSTNSESGANIRMDFKEILALDMKNVTEEYETLSKKVFPDLRVSMLHGKLPAKGGSASGGKSKQEVMEDFVNHKSDILVSTSVIEVGVDVPNATIMMIEGAERFGLAQLYQFRGRVGRGDKQSFCLLFTESSAKTAEARLKALVSAKNGFELAEEDLKIRGPGQFLGGTQAGIPDVAMQSLRDPNLVKEAREAAEEIVSRDPELRKNPLIKTMVEKLQSHIHME